MSDLYSIPLATLAGQPTSLAPFRGKVLLLVNVASRCGFTPQYTGLESLYQRFKDRGLVVLGFPANDFAGQEPGTDADIQKFCSLDYPVTFPLFSKIVVTGPAKHPLYAALIAAHPQRLDNGHALYDDLAGFLKSQNLPAPNSPPELLWNFEKFLIARDGSVLDRFPSDIAPDDPRLVAATDKALNSV
ncbi:MAG TPA: glutathione peroxidase [Acidobacteriaceae bacterium]|jgi:glutathione peroxidase|nr:glutathione peroxidase [Acidobacteriaceae bacterium]